MKHIKQNAALIALTVCLLVMSGCDMSKEIMPSMTGWRLLMMIAGTVVSLALAFFFFKVFLYDLILKRYSGFLYGEYRFKLFNGLGKLIFAVGLILGLIIIIAPGMVMSSRPRQERRCPRCGRSLSHTQECNCG